MLKEFHEIFFSLAEVLSKEMRNKKGGDRSNNFFSIILGATQDFFQNNLSANLIFYLGLKELFPLTHFGSFLLSFVGHQ